MKALKRILTVVTFCFALALLVAPMQSEAAPKLSKKKLTVDVGKKATLTVKKNKKKVKWSSSVKKVASVNQKGVVTGKAAGKTVITAKVGKKSLKCNVTVKSVLSTNTTNVTLKPGQKLSVKVTFTKSATVYYKEANEDIAEAEWSRKWKNNKTDLYITGKDIGKTTITITNDYNKEKVKINVNVVPGVQIKYRNKMGATFAQYDYKGNVEKLFTVDKITKQMTYYDWSKEYTGELYIDGTKIFDDEGANKNSYVRMEWKLYKNGVVFDSGSVLSAYVREGERFAGAHVYLFDLTDGVYEFEITYEIAVGGYERLRDFIKKYGVTTDDGRLGIAMSLEDDDYEGNVAIYYNQATDVMEFVYIQEGSTNSGVASSMLATMVWDGKISSDIDMTIYQESLYPTSYGDVKGIIDFTTSFKAPEYSSEYQFDLSGQKSSWMEDDTAYDLGVVCGHVAMSSWNLAIYQETGIDMNEMGFFSF